MNRAELGVAEENLQAEMDVKIRSAGDALRLAAPQMTYAFAFQGSRCNELFANDLRGCTVNDRCQPKGTSERVFLVEEISSEIGP